MIDCRRANHDFAHPAPVSLASGDTLARLCAREDPGDVVVGQVDIKDAFYRMALPAELRPYFGLRPIAVRYVSTSVHIASNSRRHRAADSVVWPRMRCLPMGWSWALWWCQAMHERAVQEAGLPEETRMADGIPVESLSSYPHLQYSMLIILRFLGLIV